MDRTDDVPARIAAAVSAHPQVERLDGGPFGTVASHFPGRRVLGVRIAEGRVEIAVIARLGLPLPQLVDELAAAVRPVLGAAAETVDVEVTVTDIVAALAPVPDPPARTTTHRLT